MATKCGFVTIQQNLQTTNLLDPIMQSLLIICLRLEILKSNSWDMIQNIHGECYRLKLVMDLTMTIYGQIHLVNLVLGLAVFGALVLLLVCSLRICTAHRRTWATATGVGLFIRLYRGVSGDFP